MKRKMWGGYVGGHLDVLEVDCGFGGPGDMTPMYAIFKTKKEALKRYEDVRSVTVSTN